MAGFEATLDELFAPRRARARCSTSAAARACSPTSGRSAHPQARIVGIDLEDPAIQAEWDDRQAPNLEYRIMKAENLPFADDEFEVATAIEVLEHVPDPEHTVAEMARVASKLAARLGPARAALARR